MTETTMRAPGPLRAVFVVAIGILDLVYMRVTEANGTFIANTVLRFTVFAVFLVVWRAARPHHT